MKSGMLVIAHGSRDRRWIDAIDQAVRQAKFDCPVAVGFLELAPNRDIEDGVRALERKGVKRIVVIPLFMTMGSAHLNEIQYALGLIEQPAVPTDLTPISTSAEIIWTSPLEDHSIVLEIVEERARELSLHPEEEVALLVGHGSKWPVFKERWEDLLRKMADRLIARVGFKHCSFATLNSNRLNNQAKTLANDSRLLVIPVFVSEGYFTQQAIPKQLIGVDCAYSGKTLLPHFSISKWIEETAAEYLSKSH